MTGGMGRIVGNWCALTRQYPQCDRRESLCWTSDLVGRMKKIYHLELLLKHWLTGWKFIDPKFKDMLKQAVSCTYGVQF